MHRTHPGSLRAFAYAAVWACRRRILRGPDASSSLIGWPGWWSDLDVEDGSTEFPGEVVDAAILKLEAYFNKAPVQLRFIVGQVHKISIDSAHRHWSKDARAGLCKGVQLRTLFGPIGRPIFDAMYIRYNAK